MTKHRAAGVFFNMLTTMLIKRSLESYEILVRVIGINPASVRTKCRLAPQSKRPTKMHSSKSAAPDECVPRRALGAAARDKDDATPPRSHFPGAMTIRSMPSLRVSPGAETDAAKCPPASLVG
jgi:hypothetical protein